MSTESHRYKYLIDDKEAFTADCNALPSQILADAGYEPADDYMLVQRTAHGSASRQSDEPIDLSSGTEEFYAFLGGETFGLTINDHSIAWGAEVVHISRLRELGRVREDDDLVWMREEGNQVLDREGEFRLDTKGIEHLRTHKREAPVHSYVYFVDSTQYTTDQAELTGAQITARIPDWNPENSLVLEGHEHDPDEVIHPTSVVRFEGRHEPAHFTVVPPATFGAMA